MFGNIYLKSDFDMIDFIWIILIKITFTFISNKKDMNCVS